jgi:hypothetical protein
MLLAVDSPQRVYQHRGGMENGENALGVQRGAQVGHGGKSAAWGRIHLIIP